MTVVGRQSGREIRPFKTESGDELLLLHQGIRKPEDVFTYEKAQNRFQTVVLRGCGWFVTFLGANCMEHIFEMIGLH